MCLFPEAWRAPQCTACTCTVYASGKRTPSPSNPCIYQASRSGIAMHTAMLTNWQPASGVATYRSADTTSPCQSDFSPIVLLSPSLSLPRHVDIVYDEMACLPSTSRENIIDVARRKAQGGSPRFNIGNIDSILETCQWGTTLDSIS